MKIILIIIGIIVYLAIGGCIAAVEESDRFDKTGKFGLNLLIWLFWPFYVVGGWIKGFIKQIKEKNNGESV